jgi:hypothetical protein
MAQQTMIQIWIGDLHEGANGVGRPSHTIISFGLTMKMKLTNMKPTIEIPAACILKTQSPVMRSPVMRRTMIVQLNAAT